MGPKGWVEHPETFNFFVYINVQNTSWFGHTFTLETEVWTLPLGDEEGGRNPGSQWENHHYHPGVQQFAPEKWWLEDYLPIGKVTFQGQTLKLREGNLPRDLFSSFMNSAGKQWEWACVVRCIHIYYMYLWHWFTFLKRNHGYKDGSNNTEKRWELFDIYTWLLVWVSRFLLPSWKLTYPLPRHFWRWFFLSPRGFC